MHDTVNNITVAPLDLFERVRAVTPLLLAAILLLAVAGKIWNLGDFAAAMSTLRFVPRSVREYLPIAVPLSELSVAALLLFSFTRRIGIYCTMAMLSLFTAFLTWQVLHPNDSGCSCFGALPISLRPGLEVRLGIVRNFGLIGLTLWWLCGQSADHRLHNARLS